MMKNFVLLENEHAHTGGLYNGPLACWAETYKGVEYFNVRRVYRGAGSSWSSCKQGIACRAENAPAMLDALARVFAVCEHTPSPDTGWQFVKPKRNGKAAATA